MAHKFQAIFDQIVTELTGLPTTGANVVASRFWPHETAPALAVYLGGEQPTEFLNNGKAEAVQIVRIEIALLANEQEHDNLLLEIKKDIYNKLINLDAPGVIDITPNGTSEPVMSDGGEVPQSLTVNDWAVRYRFNYQSIG